MQKIISCQINGDHTFTFEEALVKEQEVFKKEKVDFSFFFLSIFVFCVLVLLIFFVCRVQKLHSF